MENRFVKGYADDAGTDIILIESAIIRPQRTTVIDLKCHVKVEEGEMAYLCARTSAAKEGLCVAMCPIDANYTGSIHAIVHNIGYDTAQYKIGESFCQIIFVPINKGSLNPIIKKEGRRGDNNFGSTGK